MNFQRAEIIHDINICTGTHLKHFLCVKVTVVFQKNNFNKKVNQ